MTAITGLDDYRCERCDVEGSGRRCWCCGSADAMRSLHVRTPDWRAWGPPGVH